MDYCHRTFYIFIFLGNGDSASGSNTTQRNTHRRMPQSKCCLNRDTSRGVVCTRAVADISGVPGHVRVLPIHAVDCNRRCNSFHWVEQFRDEFVLCEAQQYKARERESVTTSLALIRQRLMGEQISVISTQGMAGNAGNAGSPIYLSVFRLIADGRYRICAQLARCVFDSAVCAYCNPHHGLNVSLQDFHVSAS